MGGCLGIKDKKIKPIDSLKKSLYFSFKIINIEIKFSPSSFMGLNTNKIIDEYVFDQKLILGKGKTIFKLFN